MDVLMIFGRRFSDPVDLGVTLCCTNSRDCLRSIQFIFSAQCSDRDIVDQPSWTTLRKTCAHPRIRRQVHRTSTLPSKDVVRGTRESRKVGVGTTHAAHGLTTCSICGVLIGDFDATHCASVSVEPDGAVVFGTDGCIGDFIGGFECDAGVV